MTVMLKAAAVFFVLGVIAAVLGFEGIAGMSVGIARILFFVFLVIFVVSFMAGIMRGKRA